MHPKNGYLLPKNLGKQGIANVIAYLQVGL